MTDALFSLHGKTAVITGAASGIGAATAVLFAQAGANVALAWNPADSHDVAPVIERIQSDGGAAYDVEVDVSSTEQVDRLMRRVVDRFGGLEVVVANAGIARDVPTAELTDGAWRELLDIDLLGVFRCFRAALPHVRQSHAGRFLATSSISGGIGGWPRHAHYSAAKAGIVGLVRTLAMELGPDGITVNAVAPGVVATPQCLDPINSLGPEGIGELVPRIPLRRVGAPEDVAALFVFLASDASAYITGQAIVVDGGATLAYL